MDLDSPVADVADLKDQLVRYERSSDPRKLNAVVLLRMALRASKALPSSRESAILSTKIEDALAWDEWRRLGVVERQRKIDQAREEEHQRQLAANELKARMRLGEPLDPAEEQVP